MSKKVLVSLLFVLYFMGGSVLAGASSVCLDGNHPSYIDQREGSLTDTSEATYQLTDQGRYVIQQIQESGQAYDLYPESLDGEAICAAYLYDVSGLLWGQTAPSRLGMYHPQDRTVCSAWELPYCYRYRGGEVVYDIGDLYGRQLRQDPSQYTQLVQPNELQSRYESLRDYQMYLGDMTFLYQYSDYLHMIGVYGNYNSHIGKHLGVQQYNIILQDNQSAEDSLLQESLGCSDAMRGLSEDLRSGVSMVVNDQPAVWLGDDWVGVSRDNGSYEVKRLGIGDTISYEDIAVMHFWEGEKLQSVLQMICEEDFYPIATVSIGEKWVGKE